MIGPKFSVTIIGFGSQAKDWALNLRDSGVEVTIALQPESSSAQNAIALGFKTIKTESPELQNSNLIVLLIPDDRHLDFFSKNSQFLKSGTHIVYAHGFSLMKHKLKAIYPQLNHSLLAPKAIASEVRYQYEVKGKIGAAYFADREMLPELKNLAALAGFNALFESSAEEECKADLFSEQSLLCSILPYVALESYNILRKNNVSKEVAFMECFLELKSISQALVSLGPEAFFKLISPNALIDSQKGRRFLIDADFKQHLNDLYKDIESNKFMKEVEIDANLLRDEVLKEWEKEELTKTFATLKNQLIN